MPETDTFSPFVHEHMFPLQFAGLTQHETQLLGLLFFMNGACWPSGKAAFPLAHMQAFATMWQRTLPELKKTDDQGRNTIVYRLETLAYYHQHFINPHIFCPFLASQEELASLRARFPCLPSVAYTLPWPNDIRNFTPDMAYRYGLTDTLPFDTTEQAAKRFKTNPK